MRAQALSIMAGPARGESLLDPEMGKAHLGEENRWEKSPKGGLAKYIIGFISSAYKKSRERAGCLNSLSCPPPPVISQPLYGWAG